MARSFVWTPEKERALELLDAGWLSQREVARELGTTRRTIEGWVRRPAFRARLEALYQERQDRFDAQWQARVRRLTEQFARNLAETPAQRRWP